jgi:outer membrane protein TolC
MVLQIFRAKAWVYRVNRCGLVGVWGALGALSGGGCVHSSYPSDPSPAVPVAEFTFIPAAERAALSPAWWTTFGDEELNRWVEAALEGSLTIDGAEARVAQAAALRTRVASGNLPEISLELEGDHDVKRDFVRSDGVELGLGFSVELDIFGRLQALEKVREWEWVEQRERLAAVRLAVATATVELYYGIVAQRHLLDLLADQRRTAETVLRLIELRFSEGLISQLDVLQQRGQVAEIATVEPAVARDLRIFELQLATLAGRAPTEKGQVGIEANFAQLAEMGSMGQPTDLLSSRPDLRAARAEVLAADADLGRAVAERWPRLSVRGSSIWLDGRDTNGSPVVALAAGLVQPLIDWGARRAETERVGALVRERLLTLSQTFILAVAEVEIAVEVETRQHELMERLEERATILRETLRQAERRYASGLTDYLSVLSVTQQLFAVEQRLVRERRELMSARVAQFVSLGGPMPEPTTLAIAGIEPIMRSRNQPETLLIEEALTSLAE